MDSASYNETVLLTDTTDREERVRIASASTNPKLLIYYLIIVEEVDWKVASTLRQKCTSNDIDDIYPLTQQEKELFTYFGPEPLRQAITRASYLENGEV